MPANNTAPYLLADTRRLIGREIRRLKRKAKQNNMSGKEGLSMGDVEMLNQLTNALVRVVKTEKELADAKRAFVESQKVGRTGDAAIAGQIAANLDIGRTFAHTAELEKAILALTPAKVADAFRKYVDPKKLVVVTAGDFAKAGERKQ